jgi:hypothetical protein
VTDSERGETAADAITQNARGKWVPSIPLPLYGLRKRCCCGRRFWTEDGYRGHYALSHILFPAREDTP